MSNKTHIVCFTTKSHVIQHQPSNRSVCILWNLFLNTRTLCNCVQSALIDIPFGLLTTPEEFNQLHWVEWRPTQASKSAMRQVQDSPCPNPMSLILNSNLVLFTLNNMNSLHHRMNLCDLHQINTSITPTTIMVTGSESRDNHPSMCCCCYLDVSTLGSCFNIKCVILLVSSVFSSILSLQFPFLDPTL